MPCPQSFHGSAVMAEGVGRRRQVGLAQRAPEVDLEAAAQGGQRQVVGRGAATSR